MEKYSDKLRYLADLLDEDFEKHIKAIILELTELVASMIKYELIKK